MPCARSTRRTRPSRTDRRPRLGLPGLGLSRTPGMKHARKHEADTAVRPDGIGLQRFLDLGIIVEHFLGYRCPGFGKGSLEIGLGHLRAVEGAPKGGQARAANQILKIGARESLGPARQLLKIDILGKWHGLGVDRKDPAPSRRIRSTDVDQLVEATGT